MDRVVRGDNGDGNGSRETGRMGALRAHHAPPISR